MVLMSLADTKSLAARVIAARSAQKEPAGRLTLKQLPQAPR